MSNSLALPSFASFSPNQLVIRGNVTIDELEGVGASLALMDNCSAWWRGDALLFAERLYHEDAYQIVPEGAEKSWQKSRWVCERFEPSRRRISLSFGHHEVLTRLEDDEQEDWMNRAEDNGWSVADLRRAIKGDEIDRVDWHEKFDILHDTVATAYKQRDWDAVKGALE